MGEPVGEPRHPGGVSGGTLGQPGAGGTGIWGNLGVAGGSRGTHGGSLGAPAGGRGGTPILSWKLERSDAPATYQKRSMGYISRDSKTPEREHGRDQPRRQQTKTANERSAATSEDKNKSWERSAATAKDKRSMRDQPQQHNYKKEKHRGDPPRQQKTTNLNNDKKQPTAMTATTATTLRSLRQPHTHPMVM